MKARAGVSLPILAMVGWLIFGLPVQVQAQEQILTTTNLNSIKSINVADDGGTLYVRLTTKTPLKATPASFTVANPPRIAFDFPGMTNELGQNIQNIERGDLRSVNVVQVGDRTRIVFNMSKLLAYDTRVNGNTLTIALSQGNSAAPAPKPMAPTPTPTPTPAPKPMVAAPTPTPTPVLVAPAPEPAPVPARAAPAPPARAALVRAALGKSITDINFRRGERGEGRVIVQLSSADVSVDVRQQGGKLIVNFLKATLPENLHRRSDVVDFGTPVTQLLAEQQGENVRLTVTPTGMWEHNAYQSSDQFVLEVKRVAEDPNRLVQKGGGRVKYAGDKLSLNFQNVDVRSVLQVIADFTDFNIVTSDSVQGSLTLRLKDVPWDQALDIILQAKGLDMRKNGNVIWIAPGEELAAREKMINEARVQVEELEPLQTESFQINYHRAKEIFDFLQSKNQTVLSKRGSVVVDDRSNKLFVTDVGSRLADLRRLVTEIDIAPKQVLIEARIVEASKGFARDLGVKLGFGSRGLASLGGGAKIGFGHTNFAKNDGGKISEAKLGDEYNTIDHFPQGGPDGSPAWSGNGIVNPFGALGLTIVNSKFSRFLNVELQAQESDGKARTISSPRVLTANNVEALIEQGTEIPYQEASSSGATSVSFKKAVLALKVKPQITPDGRLQLAIQVNKDRPIPDVTGGIGREPPLETKSVKSDVLIDNGGTVVIGGIYSDEEISSVTKVPLLGSIPVIGHLFRSTNKTKNETELLIFVTPRIVDEALSMR
ncbi:MAG: type IV pilus secretin PilQ [Betaproteobacteria bacterium]|nr:type IV pilus secretin PilQ [Betaproteobacteria bacterium]